MPTSRGWRCPSSNTANADHMAAPGTGQWALGTERLERQPEYLQAGARDTPLLHT